MSAKAHSQTVHIAKDTRAQTYLDEAIVRNNENLNLNDRRALSVVGSPYVSPNSSYFGAYRPLELIPALLQDRQWLQITRVLSRLRDANRILLSLVLGDIWRVGNVRMGSEIG